MTREEAINEIKSWDFLEGKEIEAIHTLIPELAERNDERIRKALCDIVRDMPYMETELRAHGLTVEKTVAYLEKQKEQKSTPDWMPKFLDELRSKKNYFDWDEHREIEGHILAIINWIAPDYFDRKEKEQDKCPEYCVRSHCIGCSIYEKQKERKDYRKLYEDIAKSEWFKKAYEGKSLGCDDEQEEQKPAEWDELQADFRNINEAFEDGKKEVVEHPERYGLCKPAEWSEEDEKMLQDVSESLCSYQCHLKGWREPDIDLIKQVEKEKSWFKSLRSRLKKADNRKLTEQQMNAPEEYGERKRCIKELREQLKKS